MGASPPPHGRRRAGPDRPQSITQQHNPKTAFIPLTRTFGRAYSIRPYPDGQKTGAGNVGAYCIRPINGHDRARTALINHPAK